MADLQQENKWPGRLCPNGGAMRSHSSDFMLGPLRLGPDQQTSCFGLSVQPRIPRGLQLSTAGRVLFPSHLI